MYLRLFVLVFLGVFGIGQAEPLVIGIAGGTGSGKSTLAHRLQDRLGNRAIVLSEDAYYRDQQHLRLEQRVKTNYDHPDSIEFALLKQHLIALKSGQEVDAPLYCFETHLRRPETQRIASAPVIIIEGILLLAEPELHDLFDLKIFVDTQQDLRALRRAERDMRERGRSFDSVMQQYTRTVKPMHDKFVEPSKWTADLIVPVGGYNPRTVHLIESYVLRELSERNAGSTASLLTQK